MDYLKTQLDAYKEATQKEPKAKRALIHALHQITTIAAILEREIKDRPTFEATFDQMVTKNCKLVKELARLTELLAHAKKDMDIVRNDRKQRSITPRATAVATASAAPVVNVTVNNYTGAAPVTSAVTETERQIRQTGGRRSKKAKISSEMRDTIWEKCIGDKARTYCPVCQKREIGMTNFSAGHIEAEATGGVTDVTNLIPICSTCNNRMHTTNLYEYTRKNFGRDPVFPGMPTAEPVRPTISTLENVITHVGPVRPTAEPVRPTVSTLENVITHVGSMRTCKNVIKHEHCRAISGPEFEKRSFSSDNDAIAFAKECGYTAITHKTGSQAMYYFTSKAEMKFKVSTEEGKGSWDFTSWELMY